MEENNKIDATNAVEQEQQPTQATETVAEANPVSNSAEQETVNVVVPTPRRKNGRNHSEPRNTAQAKATAAVACGEIENIATFKEKLSGSNTTGYGDNTPEASQEPRKPFRERGERGERGERRPRRPRFADENAEESQVAAETSEVSENAETPVEAQESQESKEPQGPSFETGKVQECAIEVGLTDRRAFSNEGNEKSGVVSYDAADCKCPSISLWSRIKNAVASLFGKKSDKKNRDGKFRGNKNWKNNRDRKFRGDRKGGDFRKGGNFHGKGGNNRRRFNNDKRPNGGRPRGGEGTGNAS